MQNKVVTILTSDSTEFILSKIFYLFINIILLFIYKHIIYNLTKSI